MTPWARRGLLLRRSVVHSWSRKRLDETCPDTGHEDSDSDYRESEDSDDSDLDPLTGIADSVSEFSTQQ